MTNGTYRGKNILRYPPFKWNLHRAHIYDPASRRRRRRGETAPAPENFLLLSTKVNLNQPAPAPVWQSHAIFGAICDKKTVKIKLWLEHNAGRCIFRDNCKSYFRIFCFAPSWTYLAWKLLLIRVYAFQALQQNLFWAKRTPDSS